MERCREIFERIKKLGKAAIEDFIDNRASEELFLEFKRSSDNGTGKKLSNTDRKNLGKAISAFGNSEGGVVVWGVDCSPDDLGADVAKALVPIENPHRFLSLLQGVVSGCTIPPHSGVETLIPKSNSSPHQAIHNKHYYIRAGSDFVPTPHDVLSGMFGRRPQPHVFHHFTIVKPKLKGHELVVAFGVMLHNEGPGIAMDLYAICMVESVPGGNCNVQFEPQNLVTWPCTWEFEKQMSSITSPEFILPPSANAQSYSVHLTLSPPFDRN